MKEFEKEEVRIEKLKEEKTNRMKQIRKEILKKTGAEYPEYLNMQLDQDVEDLIKEFGHIEYELWEIDESELISMQMEANAY